jgi:hypothetical protein
MKSPTARINDALNVIHRYAGIDGAHHKQWVLDQVVHMLTGTEDKYKQWVENYNHPDYEDWDTGIAP